MSKSLEELHNAIMAGTLSDTESIQQLRYRRANFATDNEMRPELRAHGLAVFDMAINTVLPKTVATNSPVIRVLQNALTEIGRLLVENELHKGAGSEDEEDSEEEKDVESAQSGNESSEQSEPLQDDFFETEDPLENNGEGSSLATVVGSGMETSSPNHSVPEKARETRHNSKKSRDIAKRTSISTQATKLAPKSQQSSQSPLGITPQPSSRNKGKGKLESLDPYNWLEKEENQMLSPKKSLIVKLQTPKLYKTLPLSENDRAHSVNVEQGTQKKRLVIRLRIPKLDSPPSQDEANWIHQRKRKYSSPAKPRRKRQKRTFKSAEYVVSDSDTSSIEPTSDAEPGMLTELSKPTEAGVPTLSSFTTTTTTTRCVQTTTTTPTSTTATSSSSATTICPQTTTTTTPTSAIQSFAVSSSSSPSTPPSPASLTSRTDPAFPPVPPQRTDKYLLAFQKGAYIALENIVEDHVADPELSLFELLDDLEENRPTVDDWERKTILRGAEWVFGALRKWAEDWGAVNGEGEGESEEELEEEEEHVEGEEALGDDDDDDVSMVDAGEEEEEEEEEDEESESTNEIAPGVDLSTLTDHALEEKEEAGETLDKEASEQSQGDEEDDGCVYEIDDVVQELRDWAEKQFESEHKRLAFGKQKVVPQVQTPEE